MEMSLMTDDAPFEPAQSESMAFAAFDRLVERLTEAAEARGGTIASADIAAEAAALKADGDERLGASLRSAWDETLYDVQRALYEKERKYPFERILVHQFAPLFPVDDDNLPEAGQLSRRIIPGFVRALSMMIGPEQFREYEARGRAIVTRLREAADGPFDWHAFYADDEAQWLANDVLVQVAEHFEELDRRRHWMIGVIDTHMPPPRRAAVNGDSDPWHFGPEQFGVLIDALYADLQRRLRSEQERASIYGRYTQWACTRLVRFLDALE